MSIYAEQVQAWRDRYAANEHPDSLLRDALTLITELEHELTVSSNVLADIQAHDQAAADGVTASTAVTAQEAGSDLHELCVEYPNGQVAHHHPPADCDDECRESHRGFQP